MKRMQQTHLKIWQLPMVMTLLSDQLLPANVIGWMSQMMILIRQPVCVCDTMTISILLRQQQQQHLPAPP